MTVKRLGIGLFVAVLLFSACVAIFIINDVDMDRSGKLPESAQAEKPLVTFGFQPNFGLNEWQEKTLARSGTVYLLSEDDGKACVKAVSEGGASALIYRNRMRDVERPYVSWQWKTEKFPLRASPDDENLAEKKFFDFSAQLYVIFHARFFMDTKAIQYVWTEHLPAGTVSRSPYTKNVMIMVLESGAAGEWKNEKRDIRKDYFELFGKELDADIEGLAFMTDADSTASSSAAYYANIEIGELNPIKESGAGGKKPFLNEIMDGFRKNADSIKQSLTKLAGS